jgi:hypothetical protein
VSSIGKTSDTGADPCVDMTAWSTHPSGGGAIPNEGIEGDEWGAYVTLDTYDEDERGIAQ